jgi:hypothetical protein
LQDLAVGSDARAEEAAVPRAAGGLRKGGGRTQVPQRAFTDGVFRVLALENTPLRADVAKQYLAEQL